MGAPLARFEYVVVLELLTRLTPDMRLVEDQDFHYLPTLQFRVLDRLLVEPGVVAA